MRVNGVDASFGEGTTLAAVAEALHPEADLAVVDGAPVEKAAWRDLALSAGAVIVLARRGVMPDVATYRTLLASRNAPGTTEIFDRAAVGVAGCGGLGSNAALGLARMGVGTLILADFDIVEPTNLNRQAFFCEDIGKPKVRALAEMLAKVNPLVRLECHAVRLDADNIPDIFSACDVVLECFDDARTKRVFVETALAALPGADIVAASGVAGLGDPNAIVTKQAMRRLWVVGDGTSGVEADIGLAAPRVAIASGHQALCAARILLERGGWKEPL